MTAIVMGSAEDLHSLGLVRFNPSLQYAADQNAIAGYFHWPGGERIADRTQPPVFVIGIQQQWHTIADTKPLCKFLESLLLFAKSRRLVADFLEQGAEENIPGIDVHTGIIGRSGHPLDGDCQTFRSRRTRPRTPPSVGPFDDGTTTGSPSGRQLIQPDIAYQAAPAPRSSDRLAKAQSAPTTIWRPPEGPMKTVQSPVSRPASTDPAAVSRCVADSSHHPYRRREAERETMRQLVCGLISN